jgi:hypothetical protein
MSDTEEIIITKASKAVKTKPEIAREKLKEKRDRLKKEKDNLLIEEAKKRLAEEQVQATAAAAAAAKAEEEKKKSDPNFLLLQQMKEMMEMMKPKPAPAPVAEPPKKTRGRKKVAEVAQEVQVPVAKTGASPLREVKAPKVKAPPKQRRKVVYLDKPIVSPTTQFVGNDIFPTEEPAPRPPQSNLVNYLLSRRNLNTFVQ